MNWQVYIVEADDGSWYTGITTDVARRFDEHRTGRTGAKYFRGRQPVAVVWQESGHDRSSASRREAEIKKMSRQQKAQLVAMNHE